MMEREGVTVKVLRARDGCATLEIVRHDADGAKYLQTYKCIEGDNVTVVRAAVLDDGFGNVWPLCAPHCGLEIVRPGKVQCNRCQYDPPQEGQS